MSNKRICEKSLNVYLRLKSIHWKFICTDFLRAYITEFVGDRVANLKMLKILSKNYCVVLLFGGSKPQ